MVQRPHIAYVTSKSEFSCHDPLNEFTSALRTARPINTWGVKVETHWGCLLHLRFATVSWPYFNEHFLWALGVPKWFSKEIKTLRLTVSVSCYESRASERISNAHCLCTHIHSDLLHMNSAVLNSCCAVFAEPYNQPVAFRATL